MHPLTQLNTPTVLIVGAGPVGLTLAIQLQRLGVSYRLIEKNAGPSTATKAMAVHSRTLEIFRALGIADQAVAAGCKIPHFRVQSDGRTILGYQFSLLDAAYPFLLSLPQPQAEELLLARLAALGGRVEWNTQLVEFSHTDTGATSVLEQDGMRETLVSRYIVGCDGARSTVRKQLKLSFEGDTYHRHFMLADVDIEWIGARDEGVFFLGSQAGYVAVAPLNGQGRYRLFVEMPYDLPPEDQRPKLDLATFQSLCDGRGQRMTLSNPSSTTAAGFQHRRVEHMRVGCVFLAGDAAHIGSPIGGQYMNMGISEAYNLAWKLAYVDSGAAGPELLDSYHEERYPVAVEAEKTAHVLTKLLTVRARPLVALRDTLLPLLTRRDKVRRKLPWMISGHKYQYRASPIVQDARGKAAPRRRKGNQSVSALPRLRAGDLAPDLALWSRKDAPQRRLLDLLVGQNPDRFTLLMFVGGDESHARVHDWLRLGRGMQDLYPQLRAHLVLDALAAPEDADVGAVLDPDWRLHDRYDAIDGALVLVRPDGYVAFIGNDAAQLKDYLEQRSTLCRGGVAPVRRPVTSALGEAA